MKINKILSTLSILSTLFLSTIACNSSSDDSSSTAESSFIYEFDSEDQPVKDFYAYIDADSQVVISAFSGKLPVKGAEDQIEDIYTKRNLVLVLSKFEEGRFDFKDKEAEIRIDTLFYAYDSEPYKTSSLIPETDSLDHINSFVYVKDIKTGFDLISGNFRVFRQQDNGILQLPTLKYKIEGDFQHIPFTQAK